jgi:uncharacterized protein YjdB
VPLKELRLLRKKQFTLPVQAYLSDGRVAPAKTLSFRSSKPSVVSVTAKGKVTARKSGSAVITVIARTTGQSKAKAKQLKIKVTVVKKAVKLKQFKLTAPKTLSVGKTAFARVSVQTKKASNLLPVFSSSNPAVLAVDRAGRLQARKPGTAKLRVRMGGKAKQLNIKVVAAK